MSWALKDEQQLVKGMVEAGVWKSMCSGSGISVAAEEQVVWNDTRTGTKYVVEKNFTLQAAGNHQREECVKNSKVLMEDRASKLGLGR